MVLKKKKGKGEFYLENKWYSIEKDDAVLIPKNTLYDFRALDSQLKLFMVHTPGYKPEDDENIT